MGDINQKIIEMILIGASVNEISTITGLSAKQLFYRLNMLKIKGYNFSRKYYYDGEIVYKLNKGFTMESDSVNLLTSSKDMEFKAILLSDLHLGNVCDRVDLLDEVYNFCIKKGIHIIINAGDFIDGFLGPNPKKNCTFEEQVNYALKIHPYDKNILNFICLGNHDYSMLENTGLNLEDILLNRRHDIVSLGYGVGFLNVKNDRIIVKHPKTLIDKKLESISSGLMIIGHTHTSKNIINGNLVNIYLTSLSGIKSISEPEKFSLPGFVKASITFRNGFFDIGLFEQYVFFDKLYKVNEFSYELIKGKSLLPGVIKYEEDRKPYIKLEDTIEKGNSLVKERVRLSQIDKFNQRFNIKK